MLIKKHLILPTSRTGVVWLQTSVWRPSMQGTWIASKQKWSPYPGGRPGGSGCSGSGVWGGEAFLKQRSHRIAVICSNYLCTECWLVKESCYPSISVLVAVVDLIGFLCPMKQCKWNTQLLFRPSEQIKQCGSHRKVLDSCPTNRSLTLRFLFKGSKYLITLNMHI